MPVLTYDEYQNTQLYAVDDLVYKLVEAEFRKLLGDAAPKFLEKHWGDTLQKLSCNSCVDVMKCFTIIL